MRNFFVTLLFAPLFALAACASNYQSDVSYVQATWPALVAAVNADVAAAGKTLPPAAVKAEQDITDAVAALSNTTAPTSLAAVAKDASALVDALPPNVVSPEHAAELNALATTATLFGTLF